MKFFPIFSAAFLFAACVLASPSEAADESVSTPNEHEKGTSAEKGFGFGGGWGPGFYGHYGRGWGGWRGPGRLGGGGWGHHWGKRDVSDDAQEKDTSTEKGFGVGEGVGGFGGRGGWGNGEGWGNGGRWGNGGGWGNGGRWGNGGGLGNGGRWGNGGGWGRGGYGGGNGGGWGGHHWKRQLGRLSYGGRRHGGLYNSYPAIGGYRFRPGTYVRVNGGVRIIGDGYYNPSGIWVPHRGFLPIHY